MSKLTRRLPQSRSTRNFYHIVLSGNRREALFSTADDRRALNKIAIDALQRFDAALHAYCLMTNHFRALVQIDDRLLIAALRRIATRYSRHRQGDMKSAQHVFERPYKAERVDTKGDFLNLLRHIHLSPVIANRVAAPADYLWSSHRAYLGYKSVAWITTEFGLSLLADNPAHARAAYRQFFADGIAIEVERAANDGKSQTTEVNSSSTQLPSRLNGADMHGSLTHSSLTDSPIQLMSKTKLALTRFGLSRLPRSSRRFLSIY